MRVLVAYETAHGSTKEIAEKVAEALREAGMDADVGRCRQIGDVSGYDAFVIGTPIWGGKSLGPFRKFLRRNAEVLASAPVAVFIASGAATTEEGKADIAATAIPNVLADAPGVEPLSIGNFAGVIDFAAYNLPMRLIMKAILRSQGGPTTGRHDHRQWDEISAWAKDVADAFALGLGERSSD